MSYTTRALCFFVFLILFKIPMVFSLEKSSSSKRCEVAFRSLSSTNTVTQKIIHAVGDAANTIVNTVKVLKRRRQKEERFQNLIKGANEETELQRTLRLKEQLEEWESRRIKRRLKSEELRIPQKTEEAETLKERGFNAAYTRGIDEMNEMIAISEQLRELRVDPYSTHIDYFANKIKEHIQFMETAVINLSQKRRMDVLKEYVETAIREKSVTYEKWIRFNVMLVELLSNKNVLLGYVDGLIASFPEAILMPTIKGKVGIMTLTRGIDKGIYVLGLVKSEPVDFLNHDLGHIVLNLFSRAGDSSFNYRIMREIRRQKENLPPKRNLEIAYWILIHEVDIHKDSLEEVTSSISSFLSSDMHKEELSGLIDLSPHLNRQTIQEVVNDFLAIYNLARLQLEKVE